MICGTAAVIFDGVLAEGGGFMSYSYSMGVLGMISMTCVFAMAVNTLSYALIGQTSPVSYQVVGHGEDCIFVHTFCTRILTAAVVVLLFRAQPKLAWSSSSASSSLVMP